MPRRRQPPLPPIKVGSVSISRYQLADGRVMIAFPTATKKRVCKTFVDAKKAREEAETIARELHNCGSEAQAFTSADRASFAQASRETAAHGVPVHVATSEWSQARIAIGSTHTLAEVVSAGLKALRKTPHPVAAVVAELLASKHGHDLNGRYTRGLQSTLTAFAAAFAGDIGEVRASQIEAHLTRLDAGPRRRDNMLGEVRHLFHFARLRGYLPDTLVTEARKVPKLDHLSGVVSIFSPAEMQLLLAHVRPDWLPFLAIAGFSGVRTEEICLSKDAAKSKVPLRWEDFDWDEREICLRAETAKTGHPRRIPILENLYAWLQPWRDRKARGPVCIGQRPDREFGKDSRLIRVIRRHLATDHSRPLVAIEWRHNALRHSYGSYRMAILRDMQNLSYEMGNSISMIKRNYHNPRPATEARNWFGLTPAESEKIVQIPLRLA